MKIFVFTNKRMNLLSGQFYVAAETKEEAKKFAEEFAMKHNKEHPQPAYLVEFSETVLTVDITPGVLPLGRS